MTFAQRWVSQRGGAVHLVNLKEHFIPGRNFHIKSGHYRRSEATVVAAKVAEQLLKTQSWQQFVAKQRPST